MRQALELATGYDCLGFSDFTARVEIRVYTASYVDGQVLPDPTPYFETLLLDMPFSGNTGFNQGTVISISVPETGGYAIEMFIEVQACSICCHGAGSNQCGTQIVNGKCDAGLPRVRHQKVYDAEHRPKPYYNYIPSRWDMVKCVCACDVEC